MSLSSWYHHQYSTWNRTRRLQQSPYIVRTDTNISRTATAMAQNGQAAALVADLATNAADTPKDKKSHDALFGPNIGVISNGPAWTVVNEKKVLTDELTQDVVRSWIEKSKEPTQPTTTLQALVNLKRPTLRLSPLAAVPEDPSVPDEHHQHHGLEFEYDCDAPKCGIYVHVLLPKDHPDAPVTSSTSGLAKLLVFETIVDGGFGKVLQLEEGAMLELGRFEPLLDIPAGSNSSALDHNATGVNGATLGGSTTNVDATAPGSTANAGRNRRRRFTRFHFRKRPQNRSVSGPALAVLDADPAVTPDVKVKDNKDDEDIEGVRVTIRLAALDEQGTELASPNEQVTYLHIVRFGTLADSAPEGTDAVEDTRPWVVQVVKREATIGPHTFHLHEIYGLTSSSTAASHSPVPTAPLPSSPTSATHTYPPSSPTVLQGAPLVDEEPSSECLLCLSSPREVVLLPCRHLVACKECALNMVEFGAGGTITQAEEPVTVAGQNAEGDADEANAGETVTPTAPVQPITTTVQPRRKRKAKGWFCPVCRQPYTSLLRIATAPPPSPGEKTEDASPDSGGAEDKDGGDDDANEGISGRGLPGFLRGLSFSRNPTDIESQAGTGRVGA